MQNHFIPAPSGTQLRGNEFGGGGFIYPDRDRGFWPSSNSTMLHLSLFLVISELAQ
jgi:hypothetical protein